MSRWNGPAYRGAKRDLRARKREEAEERNARTPRRRRASYRREQAEAS